ncbi:HAL/PAL/TAL family ammonia-lyase [Dyadobacter fanqingshengii]|uniref:Aromatic amino acid ammonia-lyase n=1 Tax=Dyadobacter fanqingshengii TaxID=2906443 RepID=A0A9X1PDI3_9BACT|nr:aromatic amino acid ammonia-lyase [Dyadobacter fanqingshengii]MCF0041655.1 aromatic amino acid ammonia-lyase [Dyadobacter fanqingshengii]USJ36629.1 aromatic amino acid ammonia-lyase [Dyadobacter fanqingshengii]
MNSISLAHIEQYAFEKKEFILAEDALNKVSKSFTFLTNFSKDKIIYGINTGFGPMAQYRIETDKLSNLQYNLIRSHSSGIGKPLNEIYARSVMVARLNSFLQANSGVSTGVIRQLVAFLNKGIVPEIFEHGSVGASGDLVQLSHLGLNLIGEGHVYEAGVRTRTSDVLEKNNITPLKMELRDGLGLINGTSCMTGIAAINIIYAKRLLQWAVAASAMLNEVIEAFDDSFSKELNAVKHHKGQQVIAQQMRDFLAGSRLIRSREELFKDDTALQRKEFERKIQEYYSVRCVPQILGPILDTLRYAQEVVENELNSTNDNPIVSPDDDNVFHGGNFHGDYISLEMDKVKIVLTKLSMLMERQLNFLMNSKLNGKFPPFLNAGTLGLNFGFQGVQFTATSTTAENQALSGSVYVHSIPNNNDNQDIVSMGTNSAVLAKQVLENSFQVMSIHIMAICQAIDLLEPDEKERLSPNAKSIYGQIRQHAHFVKDDLPQSESIAAVLEYIKETPFKL